MALRIKVSSASRLSLRMSYDREFTQHMVNPLFVVYGLQNIANMNVPICNVHSIENCLPPTPHVEHSTCPIHFSCALK